MEVVLDLGRPVLARYTHGDEMLSSAPLTSAELHEVVAKVCVSLCVHMMQHVLFNNMPNQHHPSRDGKSATTQIKCSVNCFELC